MKLSRSPVLISVIVILVFVIGLYLGTKYNSQKKPTDIGQNIPPVEPTKPELIIDKSLAVDKTYTQADNYTVFKISYPQFKNAPTDFNKKIEDQVNTGITQQKNDAADNWKARYDTQAVGENITQYPKGDNKFYFDVSWKPTQENNNFISLVLTVSAYAGGAHGYETLTSYNYDVANQKEITLADLFPKDPNYLQTISDFVRKDLTAQFRKRLNVKTKDDEKNFQDSVVPMMMDGTTPLPENFNVFTFTQDRITFYFNQYQVAPYAMGQSTVIMPRK